MQGGKWHVIELFDEVIPLILCSEASGTVPPNSAAVGFDVIFFRVYLPTNASFFLDCTYPRLLRRIGMHLSARNNVFKLGIGC